MAALDSPSFNNRIPLLITVVVFHLLLLYGLMTQTGHVLLRHHDIVLKTLILSPPQSVQKIAPENPVTPKATPLKTSNSPPKPTTKLTPNVPTQKTLESKPKAPTQVAPSQSTQPSPPQIDTHYPCTAPEYPALARRNAEEGKVLLSFLINAEGQVENSKVLQSSGFSMLDEAALKALSQCRFTPATQDGKAIAIRVTIPYIWRLNQ
ncbi:MAG: energy transducer TonB [Betaproteobacteria bacterium]|nr:energy transducer TonB [Betaproteobacteria bacterium]